MRNNAKYALHCNTKGAFTLGLEEGESGKTNRKSARYAASPTRKKSARDRFFPSRDSGTPFRFTGNRTLAALAYKPHDVSIISGV